jgi:hypothetical protein
MRRSTSCAYDYHSHYHFLSFYSPNFLSVAQLFASYHASVVGPIVGFFSRGSKRLRVDEASSFAKPHLDMTALRYRTAPPMPPYKETLGGEESGRYKTVFPRVYHSFGRSAESSANYARICTFERLAKVSGLSCSTAPRPGALHGRASYLFLSLGFRTSSSANPIRVKPSTTMTMHRPGAMIHQWSPM